MLGIFRIVLLVVEVLVSLLLIAIILVQKTKSEGLGLAFGSGMGETLFGSRAGNVLTRMTIVLAVVFLANTVLLGIVFSGASLGGGSSLMETSVPAQQGAPAQAPLASPGGPLGGAPGAPAEAPAAPDAAPLGAEPAPDQP